MEVDIDDLHSSFAVTQQTMIDPMEVDVESNFSSVNHINVDYHSYRTSLGPVQQTFDNNNSFPSHIVDTQDSFEPMDVEYYTTFQPQPVDKNTYTLKKPKSF